MYDHVLVVLFFISVSGTRVTHPSIRRQGQSCKKDSNLFKPKKKKKKKRTCNPADGFYSLGKVRFPCCKSRPSANTLLPAGHALSPSHRQGLVSVQRFGSTGKLRHPRAVEAAGATCGLSAWLGTSSSRKCARSTAL